MELMPKFKSLLETGLFVENLSRARDFYEQVLGLEKIKDSEVGCLFIVAQGQLLLLISQGKARTPTKTPGGEIPPCESGARQTLGPGHIAFAVEEAELDDWRARIKSKGVEILSEVSWNGQGRSLYFRDPDGHLLEIATPGIWGLNW
jgi:catechol 2,3-dioxygenase-like lactoylglutathione lyase family enzyme